MNEQLWWYVARASGLVAWALLSASVLWGLLVSTRLFRKAPPPAWTMDLHRFLGGIATTFTVLHLVGLVADSYVHFGPSELFVPFASRWKPGAVAWGVVAFYVLLAIEGTSLMMKKIPRAWWKVIHRGSFVLFAMATLHMLTAGTDVKGNALAWTSAIAVSAAVLFLWLIRVWSPRGGAARKGAHAAGHQPGAHASRDQVARREVAAATEPAP